MTKSFSGKKLLSLVLTLAMLLSLFSVMGTVTAYADDEVPYIYYTVDGTTAVQHNGTKQSSEYVVFTSNYANNMPFEGQEVWFVVKERITINKRLNFDGRIALLTTAKQHKSFFPILRR